MTAYYVDKSFPEKGYYEVVAGPENFRWHFSEQGREGELYHDYGMWETTEERAYLAAAEDWDENGSSTNLRLSGQLRAAATRAKKRRAS